MSRRHLALLTTLGCFSAITLLAQAPSFAPEFQVNTYTSLEQYFPKVAGDANGNFVVVWESSSNQDGSGSGIFAQRYDSTGAPAGGEFLVNTYTTGFQQRPSVAMNPAGAFVVVWQSLNQDGSAQGVFGQLFNDSGVAQGGEFQVNTYTTGSQYAPSVAMDSGGNFAVAWESAQDGSSYGIVAQRFDSGGGKQGGEIQVNTYTTGLQSNPSVGMDASGDFVIAWDGMVQGPGTSSGYQGVAMQRFNSSGVAQGGEVVLSDADGSRPSVAMNAAGDFVVAWQSLDSNIYAARFNGAGNPQGGQFQVNVYTNFFQNSWPNVAMDASGNFIVVWRNENSISGQRFDGSGFLAGSEFDVKTDTSNNNAHPSVAYTGGGNFVVGWANDSQDGSAYGVFARRAESGAASLASVDARTVTGSSSDHNGLLEAGETVQVAPWWTNVHTSSESLSGTASNLTGPAGPTYTINDATANYGVVGVGSLTDCFGATGDCYLMTVSGARPAPHWDATFTETLSDGFVKTWTLHVGASFADVPTSLNFYPFIENIFHNGITGGCGGSNYCPTTSVNRGQMAVFLLKAKHGSQYVPPPCTGIFPDVDCGLPFGAWIEELYHEGITGGCGGGNYCPNNPVTRAQMAVFLLKSEHGSTYVPPPCHGEFGDVVCPSQFADWIEELAAESVTGGCGGGDYCPGNPNTRGQMAVFLVKTFGLQLYGP